MRAAAFVLACLTVFAAAARTVWLRTEIISLGYEIRTARDRAAEVRADNDMIRADIAALSTLRNVEAAAKRLKVRLEPGVVTTVTVRAPQANAKTPAKKKTAAD